MIPPQYEVELIADAGVKKQFKVIKELYKKADEILNIRLIGDAEMAVFRVSLFRWEGIHV